MIRLPPFFAMMLPHSFSHGLIKVPIPAPPGPMRSAVEVNARHSLEPFINLREHLKGVMTGRLRIAVLP